MSALGSEWAWGSASARPAMAAPIPVKGVCTANELNIRSGPGTNYEQVKVKGIGAFLTKNSTRRITNSPAAA